MVSLPMKTLLALLPFFLQVNSQASGTGTTTRYWDCCKPSCAWSGKITLASGATPVTTCDINDSPLTNFDTASGCDGGSAYMCSNESPWAVSEDLSYGYAAVNIAGGSESSWCCACYELTFTSTALAGKKMIVQATNTGGDLGSNQFDLSIPGGGVGIYNGCTTEWGAPSSGWGAQYGGISSRADCDTFPDALKDGCYWRYDWFQGADNPTVSYKQVTCPAALTAKTGCVRADDTISESPTGASTVATYGASTGASSATSAAASSSASSVATSSAASSSPVASSSAASSSSAANLSSASSYSAPASSSVATSTSAASSYSIPASSAASSSYETTSAAAVLSSSSSSSYVAPIQTSALAGDDNTCES